MTASLASSGFLQEPVHYAERSQRGIPVFRVAVGQAAARHAIGGAQQRLELERAICRAVNTAVAEHPPLCYQGRPGDEGRNVLVRLNPRAPSFAELSRVLSHTGCWTLPVEGGTCLVPVSIAPPGLPPGAATVVITNVPPDMSLKGLPQHLLSCAGYTVAFPAPQEDPTNPAAGSTTVMLVAVSPGTAPRSIGGYNGSVVIADVMPPLDDPSLERLPSSFAAGRQRAFIRVRCEEAEASPAARDQEQARPASERQPPFHAPAPPRPPAEPGRQPPRNEHAQPQPTGAPDPNHQAPPEMRAQREAEAYMAAAGTSRAPGAARLDPSGRQDGGPGHPGPVDSCVQAQDLTTSPPASLADCHAAEPLRRPLSPPPGHGICARDTLQPYLPLPPQSQRSCPSPMDGVELGPQPRPALQLPSSLVTDLPLPDRGPAEQQARREAEAYMAAAGTSRAPGAARLDPSGQLPADPDGGVAACMDAAAGITGPSPRPLGHRRRKSRDIQDTGAPDAHRPGSPRLGAGLERGPPRAPPVPWFAQPPPEQQDVPFDPARQIYFTTQTAANCTVAALCNMLGYRAASFDQMRDFRRHPSTAEASFWLSECAQPQRLYPEDLTDYRDGWYTVNLISAWADRHLGHHIQGCYATMPGHLQPTNAAAWIQVLDALSVAHCTSAFLAHTGQIESTQQGPGLQGHFYALRRWSGLWYVMDSASAERTPITPTGQLPELLSLPVFLLHLCPRPAGGGRAPPSAAFLPIPTRGSSCAPEHPAAAGGAAPAVAEPPRKRSGVPGGRTRSAQAAGIKNADRWTAAFTAALRGTPGGSSVGAQRERSIVQTLMLRHAKDLADKDPNAPATQRIIRGLVRADFLRNNRGDLGARRRTRGGHDPYDYPSETSTESGPEAVSPAAASPPIRFGSPRFAAGSAYSPTAPALNLVSVNACGLSRLRKVAALLSHMRHVGADVIAVQEVHMDQHAAANLVPGAQALWPGLQVYVSPGSDRARGCLIAVSPSSALRDAVQVDCPGNEGRFVRVDASLRGRPITVACLHAPNTPADRRDFFRRLPDWLPADGRSLLIGGDFNCVASPVLDCVYGPQGPPQVNTRLGGSRELHAVMQRLDVHDAWRLQHPNDRDVTHISASQGSAARLDRWLVSRDLLDATDWNATVEPHAGIPTDHLPVALSLTIPCPVPMGAGLRAFPTRIFHHRRAADQLAEYVASRCSTFMATDHPDPVLAWDTEKELIRLAAWDIYRSCRKEDNQADAACRRSAAAARTELAIHGFTPDRFAAWKDAVDEAVARWQERHHRSAAVAAALDQLRGDTSSYYFHAQAKVPAEPVVLQALNRPGRSAEDPPDPADLTSVGGIVRALSYARSHFSSDSPAGLFRDRAPDAAARIAAQDQLLATLRRSLDPWQASEAEGPNGDGRLTAKELQWAMAHGRRGSSPGSDGLPYEFYVAHAGALTPVLLQVFNAAFAAAGDPSPLSRLLQGVICLVPKPGKPKDDLEHLRPITLLNTDVKLVMLIMSNRLQRPLEFLVDLTQSAFLVGRDISDNVRYHLSLATRLREQGLPCWLLISDLAKAYDSVNRQYLSRVMTAMGFRSSGVIRWVGMLLEGASSRVRLNGFLSEPFPVAHSLAQGASVSCQQWAIVLQPLVAYLDSLRCQGRLTSIPMPGGASGPASMQYADDVKHPTTDPDRDLPAIRDAYDLFARASGVSQSVAKCVLVHVAGPVHASMDPALSPCHAATGYRLQPADEPPARLLGVPFSDDPGACIDAAFSQKAAAMRAVAAKWAPLQIGLLGRAHVAQACMASKSVFVSTFLPPQPGHLKDMQDAINSYVAATDRPEEETPFKTKLYPRFDVSTLPVDAGGIGAPHLLHSFAAMRSKSVCQAFRHQQHPWATLFLHEVGLARPAGLPDTFPSGPAWAVLAGSTPRVPPIPDQALDQIATPYVREAVAAFRKVMVSRAVPAAAVAGHSVLLELTFHNDAFQPPPIATAQARTWTRLRDLRSALTNTAFLTPLEAADLDAIIGALPIAWEAVVTAAQPPPSVWQIVSPRGSTPTILEGPAPGHTGTAHTAAPTALVQQLWQLLPTGRLTPYLRPFAAPADIPARAALVVSKDKPLWAYTRDDHNAVAAARIRNRGGEPLRIVEPHLVGVWDEMHLDPVVWGVDGRSLLELSVRDVRRHLIRAAAAGSDVLGVREAGAAWPKAWPLHGFSPPDPNEIRLSPADGPQARADGLFAEQDKWCRAAAPQAVDRHEDVDRVPAFLDLTRQRLPRLPVWERVEERRLQPPPPEVPLDPLFPFVWRRLNDPTLHRPHRVTCWRILHACLGCNAFLCYARGGRGASTTTPFCCAPSCAGLDRPETLTHAFLDCPDVAPVARWLCDTWRELTGVEPPCTAGVLLCDDPRAWPAPPGDSALQLWTRLRVATLGAVWRLRCARGRPDGDARSFAHRAVQDAICTVVGAIRRDWARTQADIRYDDGGDLDRDWWSAVDVRLDARSFQSMWATPPILCSVSAAGLAVRISEQGPVPIPPA